MRIAPVLAAALALAACDRAPDAPAPKAAAKPSNEWAFGLGKNSAEIVHLVGGDAGRPDLRMVCAVGQGFLIALPELRPVASEDRLTIGAGAIAHGFAATPAAKGVQATGPIHQELLAVFDSAEPIGVNHGSQNAGPFTPPPALRRTFADSCRKLRAIGEI